MSTVVLKSFTKCSEYTSKSFEVNIELPSSLGRGPILKCPDKKISRNHVMLDWDDTGILITSTHIKPTFVEINGKEQSLTQGQSAVLNNGDSFGLLQENFWFKVVLTSSCNDDDVTKHELTQDEPQGVSASPGKQNEINASDTDTRNYPFPVDKSVMNDEKNEPLIESNSSAEPNIIEKIEDKVMITEDEEEIINNINIISETNDAPNKRKRVLPDWFSTPTVKPESDTKNSSAKIKNNKNKKSNASRVSKKLAPSSKLHELSSSDGEEVSPRKGKVNQIKNNKTKPKIQYHKISQDVDGPDFENESIPVQKVKNNSKTNVSADLSDSEVKHDQVEHSEMINRIQNKKTKPKSQYHNLSQDVDSSDFENESSVSEPVLRNNAKLNIQEDTSSLKARHSQIDHGVSDDDDDDDVDASRLLPTSPKLPKKKISKESEKNSPRKSCQYGEECYRKNPKHRKDMAHPGDSDYISHESELDNDDDDDRPECEYGLNCYRKNSQHKKDFKHTKKPQPPRNAKRKAKRKDYSDGDSENEYDFEDPFLNDSSSDDYAPTDQSGSDTEIEDAAEEEDTRRMIKEAKKFVKKRKH